MRGEKESHDGGAVLLEGMIVKTGLQDATKNVRIYGTISAVSSPNHSPAGPPTPRYGLSRLASRTPSSPRFLFYFLPSAGVVFQSARGHPPARPPALRSYFSCFSLLLFPSRPETPLHPAVFPRLVSLSPVIYRALYPTFGHDPHFQRLTLPTSEPSPAGVPAPLPPPRRHFNVTLIKSNNQYLPRKKF